MTTRPAPFHLAPVIAVSDLDRARDFYEGQLGLDGEAAPGGWKLKADKGTVLILLPGVEEAGSTTWPVATIQVEDVHACVAELRSRGVPFLGQDDLPFTLDDEGVSVDQDGMEIAWLRDPDGSILTVYSGEDVSA